MIVVDNKTRLMAMRLPLTATFTGLANANTAAAILGVAVTHAAGSRRTSRDLHASTSAQR